MAFIKVDEENSTPVELYYEDHGDGQPVVLISGYPLGTGAWDKEVYALLKAGYRTITYDRRGYGQSSKPASGYDYDRLVADLDQLLSALDLHDIILVGHSMGTGEVVRYLSKIGSKRVKKAVLISPLMPFLLKTDDNPSGIDGSVFEAIQQSILDDMPQYLTNYNNDFFNLDENLGKRVSEDALRYTWNAESLSSPKAMYESVPSWLTDFREDIAKIEIPILIIQGENDRILPFTITGELTHKAIKSSHLVVLAGAPHNIPWTHAAEINRELIGFLK